MRLQVETDRKYLATKDEEIALCNKEREQEMIRRAIETCVSIVRADCTMSKGSGTSHPSHKKALDKIEELIGRLV